MIRHLNKFLIVGLLTILIDYVTYILLLAINIQINFSKGLSFCIGAVFSYFANAIFTFEYKKTISNSIYKFILIYLLSLNLNLFINLKVINFLEDFKSNFLIAFFIATLFSASFNFIGMKIYVFKAKKND